MQDMKYTNDNDVVKYTQMCHYIMLAYLGGLNRFWITIYEELREPVKNVLAEFVR